MNERIISEINLMSEEAMHLMINNFKIQVSNWCSQNTNVVLNESSTTIAEKLQKSLVSYILLINLNKE